MRAKSNRSTSHVSHLFGYKCGIVVFAAASLDLLQLASEVGTFEFWVVMAVDDDDPYFGVTANRDDVQTYFQARIAAPLERLGVSVSLSLVAFQNDAHKPGPAFNVAAAVAYADGADFLFRLNDDTVLGERWASALVAALVNNDPPLVGVAGPACTGNRANTDILTHDFVHRTHLDIFPTYCEHALCPCCKTKTRKKTPVCRQTPLFLPTGGWTTGYRLYTATSERASPP